MTVTGNQAKNELHHLKYKNLIAATLVVPVLLASPVLAAQTGSVVDSIIVTAQKREQNIQEVPGAVTALNGDQMKELGFSNAIDLVQQVPNFSQLSIFGDGVRPNLNLRGIALNTFVDNFEPPVALYIDEVYKGSADAQALNFYDVERAEVLRGPQGTLYGRNSFAGLLHFVTRRPGDEFEGNFSVEYGKYDNLIFEGGVSVPLSDSIRTRVAFRKHDRDGWIVGFNDGRRSDDADSLGVRGTVEIDLSENALLTLRGHYAESDTLSAVQTPVGFETAPGSGVLCADSAIRAGECFALQDGFVINANANGGLRPGVGPGSNLARAPEVNQENWGAMGKLEWGFENFDVTYIIAYEEFDKYFEEDLDGIFQNAFEDSLSLDMWQLTNELRFSGQTDGGVNWLLGAYYYKDKRLTGSVQSTFFPAPADADLLLDPAYTLVSNAGRSTTDSWAVFAQTTVPITETVNLTVGGRYTEDDKENFFSIPIDVLAFSNFFDSSLPLLEDERTAVKEGVFTGEIGVDWTPRDGTLLYAKASTGWQSGGSNSQFISFDPLPAIEPVNGQDIVAYETGVKHQFWDGKAIANLALFYQDVTNLQGNQFIVTPENPLGATFYANIGDLESYGMELELDVAPVENLEFSLNVAWLEAEISTDAVTITNGMTISQDGRAPGQSPEYTVGGLVKYRIPLGELGSFTLQADGQYRDRYELPPAFGPFDFQDAYGLLNLRGTWRGCSNDQCSITAFATNVTNQEWIANSATFGGRGTWGVVHWGADRRWGVRVGYEF